jgi:hypothetical protein
LYASRYRRTCTWSSDRALVDCVPRGAYRVLVVGVHVLNNALPDDIVLGLCCYHLFSKWIVMLERRLSRCRHHRSSCLARHAMWKSASPHLTVERNNVARARGPTGLLLEAASLASTFVSTTSLAQRSNVPGAKSVETFTEVVMILQKNRKVAKASMLTRSSWIDDCVGPCRTVIPVKGEAHAANLHCSPETSMSTLASI